VGIHYFNHYATMQNIKEEW